MQTEIPSGSSAFDPVGNFQWSPAEKKVARRAFDRALQAELQAVMVEAKRRAEKMRRPCEVWDLEQYLTKRRTQIDRQFDYRYSVLIMVFGILLRDGKLTEQDLDGMSEDKLASIRRFDET